MINKQWQTGKRVIKGLIGVVLAVTCVMALAACSGNEGEGKLESGVMVQTDEDWKVSQYSFEIGRKEYSMMMPAYSTLNYDYCDYLQCSYKGEEADMYVFQLNNYAYTGHSDDGTDSIQYEDVTECKDALDKSEWLIERTLARIYAQNREPSFDEDGNEIAIMVDVSYKENKKMDTVGIDLYYVEATEGDTNLYGYWIYNSSISSTLILADNKQMINDIISTIYISK